MSMPEIGRTIKGTKPTPFVGYPLDAFDFIPLHRPDAKRTYPNGKVKPIGKAPLDSKWTAKKYESKQVKARCLADRRNGGIRLRPEQLVVDIDPRNGGDRGWLQLCADLGIDDSPYPKVDTGSGGVHLYMAKPADLLVRDTLDSEDYDGVEFKSVGRQVVAAGSIHPNGKPYKWDMTHPTITADLPLAPRRLLKAIERPAREESAGGGDYSPDQIASRLSALNAEDFSDHSMWLQLMQACHHASGGDARQEFVDFSTQDPAYAKDSYIIGKRWDSLHAERPGAVTHKSLEWFVQKHGDPSRMPARVVEAGEFGDDLTSASEVSWLEGGAAENDDDDKLTALRAEASERGYRIMPMYHDELDAGKMLDHCDQAFRKAGAPLFQMAGRIVHPYRTLKPSQSEDAIRRPENALTVAAVNDVRLQLYMIDHAPFYRVIKPPKGGEPVFKLMAAPMKLASQYIARDDKRGLRPLTGVIETPTLRRDGSILQKPGYDDASGIMLDLNGVKYPKIPEEPTHDDARKALKLLKRPFKDFPFVKDGPDLGGFGLNSSASESVMLSAMLTAVVRRSLATAPAHGVTAPMPGTGKTLAIQVVAMTAMGRDATATNQGATDEEDEKRIGALLLDGDQVILVDNCTQPVGGATICAVLTSSVWGGRTLGKTERFKVPTSSLFFFNGNALKFRHDMTRRALLCQLDARTEFPENRKFDVNLEEWVPTNRTKLVVAALTVLRAFVVAGRPGLDSFKPLGSFREWSDLVRGALIWLGEPDPVLTQRAIRRKDPEKSALAQLLSAIIDWKGREWFTSAELHDAQFEDDRAAIGDALDAVLKRTTKLTVGHFLADKEKTIVGGMELQCQTDKHRKSKVYRVVKK